MICEPEDFNKYPYNIADAEGEDTDLQTFIDTVERDVLIEVFGRAFFDEFEDNIEDEPFVTLIAGASYVDEKNKKRIWGGLKGALIPYVYAKYLAKDVQLAGGTGLENTLPENSERVSPATKISQANAVARKQFESMFVYLTNHDTLFDDIAYGMGYVDFETYMEEEMANVDEGNEFDL